MKKKIENIIYILLAIGSIFLGVSLLEGSLLYTGIFFVFVPSITVGYYFSTKCKNVITLPSILLLYIALGLFVLIPVDLWLGSQDIVYSDSIVEQEHYIPKEGDRLYPEGGFSKPEDLADGFHGLRTEEQLARNYDQNTFHVYNGLQWGMYTYDAWLDIPAEGYIFMKVYTMLTNIELSADSIKERSMIKVSSTNGEVKKFSLSGDLKIYEGGMGQYQGARFELRYMPLLAGVGGTQKLLEDYYIVDGWER